MRQKRKRMGGRGKNSWPPTSCLGRRLPPLLQLFSDLFPLLSPQQEAKVWPATALPWRPIMWRCLGMLKMHEPTLTPLHHFTHPRHELWSNAGWRSWKTLAWTAALRGNLNLHLSCLDLTSQAATWSRRAGGVCAGGVLAHNFQSVVQGAHRKSRPRTRAQPLFTWLLFDAVFVSSLHLPPAAGDPSSMQLFVFATGKNLQPRKICLWGKG